MRDYPLLDTLLLKSYSPQIILGEGIAFGTQKQVFFGDSTEDVLSCLGTPDQIFYKKHDKLKIFSKLQQTKNGSWRSNIPNSADNGHGRDTYAVPNSHPSTSIDYFYNYFGLGIDLFFQGDTHQVKKIILHTNFCGSKDFNVYSRCNFFIPYREFFRVNGKATPQQFVHQKKVLLDCNTNLEEIDYKDEDSPQENQRSRGVSLVSGITIHEDDIAHLKSISPMTNFSDIRDNLTGIHCGQPVTHHSTSKENPFGGTEFYPFKHCIFEVLSNNQINSVTLF